MDSFPYEDGEIEDNSLTKNVNKIVSELPQGNANSRNVPGTIRKTPNVPPAKNISAKLDDNSDYAFANGGAGGIGQVQGPSVGLSGGSGTNRGGPDSTGIPFKVAGTPSNLAVSGSTSSRPTAPTVNKVLTIYYLFYVTAVRVLFQKNI